MLPIVLRFWLDWVAFAGIAGVAAFAVHRWLRRGGNAGLARRDWAAIVIVIGLGAGVTYLADRRERDNLRQRLEGLAPTYAQEIEILGHARVDFDTKPDAPEYLKLVQAEIRWERVNPNVSDIYTYRRDAAGKIAFVVDSETDYDHDGKFDGEREQRTAIGEEYPQATANFIAALDGHSSFDGEPYTDRWGTWISAYVPLRDEAGRVEAALGVDFSARRWYADIILSRLGALAGAGVLLTAVLGATALMGVSRGELAKRVSLQNQLVDASRQAGMAEMATGVLHNVGNVLNSVNVSAGLLTEKLRGSRLSGLGRAADMIRSHKDDLPDFIATDAKGRVLPDYLVKVSDLLADEQREWLAELSSLTRNLDHAKRVVASQQTLAKRVGVVESFEPVDVVDDALRITQPAVAKADVTVLRSARACPALTTDRHAVLQVLVNLIGNAVNAMADAPERRLIVGIDTHTDAEGAAVARITVTDTGHGIAEGDLTKLFGHGFTTRAEGHGFGLHHSANAAHALGGGITAASDGPGRGATFTLTLPLVVSEKGLSCLTA